MKRTREEHIQFCKEQAYKQYYYDMAGQENSRPDSAIANACISMLSDLGKHPETDYISAMLVFLIPHIKDEKSMRSFIDGFN
jgi:hypothetical protein